MTIRYPELKHKKLPAFQPFACIKNKGALNKGALIDKEYAE
ncbi:MAG: hypothetical protein ACAF41_09335 [Leptolyngbya sp. BL-A-14]